MRDGRVTISGIPAIARRVPLMLRLSPIADRVAAVSR
jgi:hypothetical protein